MRIHIFNHLLGAVMFMAGCGILGYDLHLYNQDEDMLGLGWAVVSLLLIGGGTSLAEYAAAAYRRDQRAED